MKDRDGNELVLVPRSTLEHILEYWNGNQNERAMTDALEHILETVQEAIAAAPQFVAGEFTDEVAARVLTHFSNFPVRLTNAQNGHDMIAAVRSELGPALGLVEIREPTPEECERICTEYERLLMREGTCGGRDAFDAVRAVLWPKEGL